MLSTESFHSIVPDRQPSILDRVLARLIAPKPLPDDTHILRRMQLLVAASFLLSGASFFFLVVSFLFGGTTTPLPLLLVFGVAAVVYPFLYRWTSYRLPGILLTIEMIVLLTLITIANAGTASGALFFFGLIPLLGTMLVGTRFGLVSGLLSAVAVTGIYSAEYLGIQFTHYFEGSEENFLDVCALLTVIGVSASIGWLYESGSLGSYRELYAELQRAHEFLKRSETRYRSLVQNSNDLTTVLDGTGTIVYESPSLRRILGYDPIERTGHQAFDNIHPDDLDRMQQAWRDLLRGELRDSVLKARFKHAAGHWVWIEFNVSNQLSNPDVAGVVVNGRDVNERVLAEEELERTNTSLEARIEERTRDLARSNHALKNRFIVWEQAMRALRQSETRFRSVFEGSPDPLLVEDISGVILDANPAAGRMYGMPAEQMIGRDADSIFGEAGHGKVLQTAGRLDEGGCEYFEVEFCTRTGEKSPFDVRLSRIIRDDQPALLLHLRDSSERKRYEADLMKARDRAEEMARMKSTFLAVMSHEIRTPLTGIIGFADILGMELTGEHQEFIQYIRQSGQRLLETINSILDLARLEAGETRPKGEFLDAASLIHETVQLLTPIAREKGLHLVTDLPESGLIVRLDRSCLHRIIVNLVGNAIKFTEAGEVRVSLSRKTESVELQVSDTGVGIAPEFLPQIFNEFRQESNGLARSHEGSGLGLAITRRLVSLLGGTIHVDSEKGRGSVFTVQLPMGLSEVGSLFEQAAEA